MKKKIIASLLSTILVLGAVPLGASAEWRQTSDNQWNWLDESHLKVTSWKQIDGTWYYFDNNGNMKTGWIDDGTHKCYANASGAMQKGWQKIDNLWYHFGDAGIIDTDKVIEGYYLGENGVMQELSQNKVLFEDEYAKVTYIGINRDSQLGPKLKVQIQNKSDKTLCLQTKKDVSVDGSNKNASFNEEIPAKSAIVANFTLPSSTDKNFKNVKGEINILDKNSWNLLKSEEFSISF